MEGGQEGKCKEGGVGRGRKQEELKQEEEKKLEENEQIIRAMNSSKIVLVFTFASYMFAFLSVFKYKYSRVNKNIYLKNV